MTEPPSTRFPGESTEYRFARDKLLGAEVELRQAVERVAAQRRALPVGGAVPEDYVFEEAGGSGSSGRFSELFAPGKDTLVVYSFMFPRYFGDTRPGPAEGETARLPLAETPCPSCTSILDSLDGAAPHLAQLVSLVVVAKSDPDSGQRPILNVFTRDADGFHHRWATELMFAPREVDQDPRHVDSIWPLWNVLDMTPGGRAGAENIPAGHYE
jgi:predicted dithiol-disulfide oxidoreductase (DUF899 family)